jgi:hypothetical protein
MEQKNKPTRIFYTFGNTEYYQDELTIQEDSEVMEIFEHPDIKTLGNLDFNFLKYFITKKLHVKFLQIVLKNKKTGKCIPEIEINKLKNTELLEVLNDFFTLNALLQTILKAIGSAFIGTNGTRTSENSSTNANSKTPDSSEKP